MNGYMWVKWNKKGFGVSLKQLVSCWLHLKTICRRECNRCLIQLPVLGCCWLPCKEHNQLNHLCTMSWSFGTFSYKHPLGHLALHSWAHMHHTGSQENEVGPESRRKYRSRNLWECQSSERSYKSARIISRARSRKASPGAF